MWRAHLCHGTQAKGSGPWNPETRGGERAPAGVGLTTRPVARTRDLSEGPIVTLGEHFVPHSFIH